MDFLPAIRIPSIGGGSGIAMNINGTLLASVDCWQHCVHVQSMDDSLGNIVGDPIIVGTPGIRGNGHGQLSGPRFACFVHRNDVDTLLICDFGNERVVEVSSSGVFLRTIAVRCSPYGIAYCGARDVIVVSLHWASNVILLHYETGTLKSETIVGLGTLGDANGGLNCPRGVACSADGDYILVADSGNHRVSKFSAASGKFIAHVATSRENGIWLPSDVLECSDGSIVVTQGDDDACASVICLKGGSTKHYFLFKSEGCAVAPWSLAHAPSLHGVLVKTFEGLVFVLRDAWFHSSRAAWVSAVCIA